MVVLGLAVLAFAVEKSDQRGEKIRGDLTRYSLAASRILAAKGNPYSKQSVGRNYKYLPTNAIVLLPLTKVSEYRAQGIWFAINVGLLLWCVTLHHRILAPARVPVWVTAAALAVCIRMVWQNLKLGQWNTSVYCLSFIGLFYLYRHRRVAGALALGLASVLKFTPLVFLLFFAVRRQWKVVSLLTVAILLWIFMPPVVIMGPAKTADVFRTFVQKSWFRYNNITMGPNVYSVSLRSTVYRYLYPATMHFHNDVEYTAAFVNLGAKRANRIALVVSLFFAAGTLFLTFRYAGPNRPLPPLGYLALLGNWYAMVTLYSPGLREAQMITVFTPLFAVAASLTVSGRSPSAWQWLSLAVIAVSLNATTRIFKGTTYQNKLLLYGILAVAQLLLWLHTLYIVQRESREATRGHELEPGETIAAPYADTK